MLTIDQITSQYDLDDFERGLLTDLYLGDSLGIRPGVTVYRWSGGYEVRVQVIQRWARSGC